MVVTVLERTTAHVVTTAATLIAWATRGWHASQCLDCHRAQLFDWCTALIAMVARGWPASQCLNCHRAQLLDWVHRWATRTLLLALTARWCRCLRTITAVATMDAIERSHHVTSSIGAFFDESWLRHIWIAPASSTASSASSTMITTEAEVDVLRVVDQAD